MLRNLATQISRYFAERSHAARLKRSVPLKITFAPAKTSAKRSSTTMPVFMTGETYDLSRSGIAFIVSSIRIMENYLVGEDRVLIADLDLPKGKIQMKVIGKRYERVGVHLSTERYIVGAEIIEITETDRRIYEQFLGHPGNGAGSAAQLELGID